MPYSSHAIKIYIKKIVVYCQYAVLQSDYIKMLCIILKNKKAMQLSRGQIKMSYVILYSKQINIYIMQWKQATSLYSIEDHNFIIKIEQYWNCLWKFNV